jgi:pyridoxamine 5'-phosphate oxidase
MLDALLLKLTRGDQLPERLPDDPMPLFTKWFQDGMRETSASVPMPDAMALATATRQGEPTVRYVLCKYIDPSGAVHFFTNFQSRKATDLTANPRAAGVFYWPAKARQARLEGAVQRLSDEQSDAYFATRPLISRIGAWASRQSQPLESRQAFVRDLIEACNRLKVDPGALFSAGAGPAIHVPRPPHWGGFRLQIRRVELWIGAEGRLHDRAEWVRDLPDTTIPDAAPSPWRAIRLYP